MSFNDQARWGIPLLDDALGGGLPRGSIILLEDEIGIDKESLLIQFLSEGLRTGEYGYIMSTEHVFEHYSRLFIPFNISEVVLETKRLVFLDAFSNPFGYSEGRPIAPTENVIRDITQPRQVTDHIRRALLHVQKQPVRGVLDSLTTLLLISDTLKAPMSFLQHKIATDKKSKIVSLLTLHADVHDPRIIRAIEHYCDGVIRLKRTFFEEKDPPTYGVVLEIVKMYGVSLSDLDHTRFTYHPAPGNIELVPLD